MNKRVLCGRSMYSAHSATRNQALHVHVECIHGVASLSLFPTVIPSYNLFISE